jgi:hypothetical protein
MDFVAHAVEQGFEFLTACNVGERLVFDASC